MKLEGKTIIVTGSGTGIGKAIAKLCTQEGANLIISDKDEALANKTAQELGPDQAFAHIQDLTEEGCAKDLVHLAKERFGRVDSVIDKAEGYAETVMLTTLC